jgi:hypothetical protein
MIADGDGWSEGTRRMAKFEDGWMISLPGGIAAAAIFRRLGVLCAPAAAEALPPAMAALVARLPGVAEGGNVAPTGSEPS